MSEQFVTSRELSGPQFLLLNPGHYPARTGEEFQKQSDWRHITNVVSSMSKSKYLALDFETMGGDISDTIQIVGIGLAWDTGSAYFHWLGLSISNRETLLEAVLRHPRLLAHNIAFDGGVLFRECNSHANWYACTYALLAMLANESPEQRWGLKDAMVSLLGWESSNETLLDEWLVLNGFHKGAPRIDTSEEYRRAQFLSGGLKADKGQMWRAPADILGKYCVLDAEACYLLFTKVLEPVYREFPGLVKFNSSFLHHILLHVEQKMHGILMDKPGLLARRAYLIEEIESYRSKFRCHPEVDHHIDVMESEMRTVLEDAEPAKMTIKGLVSKNWIKWNEKVESAYRGELPEYNFNIQSGAQLRDLFYTRMRYHPKILTDKGEPSTANKALKKMGEAGNLLMERAYLSKELTYIDKYIELVEYRQTIHPSFRMPGTVTGRLSSKEPNLQQVSKSKAVMSLFRARPGHVWVDLDFAALEAMIATEFSEDPNLLTLYGNGVPENDIHLFVAASVPGAMGRKVLDTGYTPVNPPTGSVSKAKKEAKKERSVAKTVVYACIAEGTPIRVRSKGWLPIQEVQKGDYVWDGHIWVHTDGAISKGTRVVFNLNGVLLTPDHKVLGEDNVWRPAMQYKIHRGTGFPQPSRPGKPNASWSDVWALAGRLLGHKIGNTSKIVQNYKEKKKGTYPYSLFERIPNLLIYILENLSEKVGTWNIPQTITPVYDLLNCGPGTRFVSGIHYNLVTSNCQFGAGINKVMETLENDDVYLDRDEVALIHGTYWETFAKLKDFGRSLYFEWKRNKGYILNGTGRPMAVPEEYTKDLLSRFIQSTGHDVLVRYVEILSELLTAAGIRWYPLIVDFHDAVTVEVPESCGEETAELFRKAMDILNGELGGIVELKGTAVVGRTLADCKEPEV